MGNSHKIIHGDCIKGMKTLPDGCIHTCITSPPYFGLRNYNGGTEEIGCEESPEAYIARVVQVFREVRRILRDDGTVWLNLGDSYASNGCYINAWYEKEHNKDKKHLHTENRERYEDRKAFRGGEFKIKAKDLVGIPWRVAFALQADGWYLRQDIIWSKPNPMPESVTDRCTKSHEYIFLLSKNHSYYYDNDAIKEDAVTAGKPARAFGATKQEGTFRGDIGNIFTDKTGKRNRRSVWTVNTKPYQGAHFAVYPKQLIEPCVLAGCPIGGNVFDPFTGSGTTAVVALENGRNFIGTELNAEYIKIAEERILLEIPATLDDVFTEDRIK